MKRPVVLVAVALTLGGCSTLVAMPYQQPTLATPYQAQTSWTLRGGYSETKQADDRYSVTFSGNGEVPFKAAEDFALMRGAELCKTAGYEYLTMVSGTIFTDRLIYNGMPITSPRAVAEIKCGHEEAGARLVSDVITTTEASYPLMHHPSRQQKAAPAK